MREPYPEWFGEFRDQQIDAIDRIMEAYAGGARVVILDAPTGSGKTLIGEEVRRRLERQTLYVCSTKSLQDQFAHDYHYAKVLKGRANYPTFDDEANAADCTWTPDTKACNWCPAKSSCPYEVAKMAALKADLAVLNVAYMLTECNGPGRFSKRGFVIADEADVLEAELLRYVGMDIAPRQAASLGLDEPTVVTHTAKSAVDSWVAWCDDAIQKVVKELALCANDESLRGIRRHQSLVRLYQKVVKVRAGIIAGGWIYTGGKHGGISFKPIRVDGVGSEALWPHGDRFLLMSASIISPDDLAESLGIQRGEWEYVGVSSSFPLEHRRVKVIPVANMARKPGEGTSVEAERNKMVEGIRLVIARHPGERVLVHAVSYDLSGFLAASLIAAGVPCVFDYSKAGERDAAMRAWLRSDAGVLIAPSLDRGIDLKDDLCRVVVIAKVPFPNLGDKQIAARLYTRGGGDAWYTTQTARTIVQMTGRACRHKDDWSVSYILDSQFSQRLWTRARRLFPVWWTDALDWRDTFTSVERRETARYPLS